MRRRFSRTPFRRRRFKRRVSWLTDSNQRSVFDGTDLLADAGAQLDVVQAFPLTHIDNDFVENHPRFAKRNDVVSYRRILGEIRFGLYNVAGTLLNTPQDFLVTYGLAFVEGDYDNAGTWTAPNTTLPDPRETGDEDDKWLFKNRVWLSLGQTLMSSGLIVSTTGTDLGPWMPGDAAGLGVNTSGAPSAEPNPVLLFSQPTRPVMLSNDQQLPNGSHIDIKTRRKSQYGEKLYLLAVIEAAPETTIVSLECVLTWQLRVLING